MLGFKTGFDFGFMFVPFVSLCFYLDQKRVLDSLELELQAVLNHLTRCYELSLGHILVLTSKLFLHPKSVVSIHFCLFVFNNILGLWGPVLPFTYSHSDRHIYT